MELSEKTQGKPLNAYICAEIRRTYATVPMGDGKEAGDGQGK